MNVAASSSVIQMTTPSQEKKRARLGATKAEEGEDVHGVHFPSVFSIDGEKHGAVALSNSRKTPTPLLQTILEARSLPSNDYLAFTYFVNLDAAKNVNSKSALAQNCYALCVWGGRRWLCPAPANSATCSAT